MARAGRVAQHDDTAATRRRQFLGHILQLQLVWLLSGLQKMAEGELEDQRGHGKIY